MASAVRWCVILFDIFQFFRRLPVRTHSPSCNDRRNRRHWNEWITYRIVQCCCCLAVLYFVSLDNPHLQSTIRIKQFPIFLRLIIVCVKQFFNNLPTHQMTWEWCQVLSEVSSIYIKNYNPFFDCFSPFFFQLFGVSGDVECYCVLCAISRGRILAIGSRWGKHGCVCLTIPAAASVVQLLVIRQGHQHVHPVSNYLGCRNP